MTHVEERRSRDRLKYARRRANKTNLLIPPQIRCRNCGKEFQRIANAQAYCTTDCYEIAKKKREFRPVNIPMKCPNCGIDFIRQSNPQKYCSKKCKTMASDKRNPATKKPWYVSFMNKKRDLIRSMGECCYLCGAREGQFELHHLTYINGNPYRERGSTNKAWKETCEEAIAQPDNFRLLCRGCHSTVTHLTRTKLDLARFSELVKQYSLLESANP